MININQLAPPPSTTEQIETSILATNNNNAPSKIVIMDGSNKIGYTNSNNVLNKNSSGWVDIIGDIIVKSGNGVGIPTYAQIGTSIYSAYKFTVNDYVICTYHLNHGFAPNNPIYIHTHFITGGSSTNVVKFEYSYVFARANQTAFLMASPSVITSQTTPNGTPYFHYVSETTTSFDTSNYDIDTVLMVKLKRITNGSTDNGDDVFVLCSDLHALYSQNLTSTNKSYPFN